ncbi:MAG TPA: histidine kinase dimerization/phospho-acceptor domain-containing protein [Verrucomicrobiales bacterium]|nr:histidine kinase dimerization/phospho-acceptor domain-containing protein [Verrucomicrobiales bacterium]
MAAGSLKGRLLGSIVAAMVATTMLGGWLTYFLFRDRLLQGVEHALLDKMRFLQLACVQRGRRVAFAMTEDAWLKIQGADDPEYFQFRFAGGKTILRSRTLEGKDLPAVGAESEVPVFADVTLPDGSRGRCLGLVFVPQDREGQAEPARVHLSLAHPLTRVETALRDLRHLLVQVGLLSTGAVALAALVVVRRRLEPLRELERQIETRPLGENGGHRFHLQDAPRELHPVVQRLNAMMTRVEDAIERERQFAANTAHELRNPLAGMRARIELILSRDRSSEDYRGALHELLDAELRMQQAVEQLLLLAKLESPAAAKPAEEIVLQVFLRRCWKPHYDAAESRGLRVQWRCDAGKAPFRSSPALLELALNNLFANAATYTPEGGRVSIRARVGPEGDLDLVVANTNPGLTREELPGLFRRFFRAPEAEPRGGNGGEAGGAAHMGIGLGLCRRILETLGGDIGLRLESDLFCVSVRVPGAKTAKVGLE